MRQCFRAIEDQLDTMLGVDTVTVFTFRGSIVEKFTSTGKLAYHTGIASVDDTSGRAKKQKR